MMCLLLRRLLGLLLLLIMAEEALMGEAVVTGIVPRRSLVSRPEPLHPTSATICSSVLRPVRLSQR